MYKRISSVKHTCLSSFFFVLVRHLLNTSIHHFVKAHFIQTCEAYTDSNIGGTVSTTDVGQWCNFNVSAVRIDVLVLWSRVLTGIGAPNVL